MTGSKAFGVALAVILWAIALIILASATRAETKTVYGPDGRVVTRSTTDSQGSTVYYGADGKVQGRSVPSSAGTTFYDPAGKVIGKASKSK